MAVMAVFGGRLTWCADNDKHIGTILAARFPGVPNLGDLTALDWAHVEHVAARLRVLERNFQNVVQ
jgi:DNA (cytosine-5)-methyltransferase 1